MGLGLLIPLFGEILRKVLPDDGVIFFSWDPDYGSRFWQNRPP